MTFPKKKVVKITVLGKCFNAKITLLRTLGGEEKKTRKSLIKTQGLDSLKVRTKILSKEYEVQIWYTVGQERFDNISFQYLKNSDGIVLVVSENSRESNDALAQWIENIEKKNCKIPVIVIGNSVEKKEEKQIDFEEIKIYCESKGMRFFSTTLYNKEVIQKVFQYLFVQVVKFKEQSKLIEEFKDIYQKNTESLFKIFRCKKCFGCVKIALNEIKDKINIYCEYCQDNYIISPGEFFFFFF